MAFKFRFSRERGQFEEEADSVLAGKQTDPAGIQVHLRSGGGGESGRRQQRRPSFFYPLNFEFQSFPIPTLLLQFISVQVLLIIKVNCVFD